MYVCLARIFTQVVLSIAASHSNPPRFAKLFLRVRGII